MCSVSAVSDYFAQPGGVFQQRFPNAPNPTADPEVARLLREVVERLDKIDKRLGDVECKDEVKAAFLKEIGAAT